MTTQGSAKSTRTNTRYSVAVTGEIFELMTGRFVTDVGAEKAYRMRRLGGLRLDRHVERIIKEQ